MLEILFSLNMSTRMWERQTVLLTEKAKQIWGQPAMQSRCPQLFDALASYLGILQSYSNICFQLKTVNILVNFQAFNKASLKRSSIALAGVAQWTECWPVNCKVAVWFRQGACLGCRAGPHWGACGRQPLINVCLPLFLPPFPPFWK